MSGKDPLRNLGALRHKLAHHASKLEQLHARHLVCRKGCDGCCQTERTVSAVEYRALSECVSRMSAETRQRLADGLSEDHCSLLLDGACAAYEERPIICRSHGLPLVMEGQRDICPLNFTEGDIDALPEDELLSVDALTAILVVVNRLFSQEEKEDASLRRPVGDLFF